MATNNSFNNALPATFSIGGTSITPTTAGKAVLSATSVLVQRVSTTIAAANGTTSIPNDNTPPQSGEGTQIGSVTITPLSATNILVARLSFGASNNTSNSVTVAMFYTTALPNASAADIFYVNNLSARVALDFAVVAGVTSALTFSARIGAAANTWYVSSNSSAITLGSLIAPGSVLEVLEYTP